MLSKNPHLYGDVPDFGLDAIVKNYGLVVMDLSAMRNCYEKKEEIDIPYKEAVCRSILEHSKIRVTRGITEILKQGTEGIKFASRLLAMEEEIIYALEGRLLEPESCTEADEFERFRDDYDAVRIEYVLEPAKFNLITAMFFAAKDRQKTAFLSSDRQMREVAIQWCMNEKDCENVDIYRFDSNTFKKMELKPQTPRIAVIRNGRNYIPVWPYRKAASQGF